MNEPSVILAVEDLLSEIVSIKILAEIGVNVSQKLGWKGQSYLQQRAPNLNQTARRIPVFMLTDLDSPGVCPPQLIESWVKGRQNPLFFLRVAVMEVESWVMADRKGLADFLSIPLHRIPEDTDAILRPKELLSPWHAGVKRRGYNEPWFQHQGQRPQ